MTNDLQKRFGLLLSAIRRKRGLTQAQLAEAAGLSLDMIARIESGGTGVSFGSMEKLAGALRVDPAEFFSDRFPEGSLSNTKLTALTAKLARLSETELVWIDKVFDSVISR